MAAEQMRRENATDERDIVVEKDRVPKMTTHFESLAGKSREEQQYVPLHGEKEIGSGQQVSGTGEGPSSEELSNLRATTIGAAEERNEKAKETGAKKAKEAKDCTAEKAKGSKDTSVDTTKSAAGYVGKVAAEVKDQAVVAGWGTTQYTLEKVAEATKAAVGITSSVAGYTGEKAVAAKDKVAGAGKTVVSYAGEKIAAAKDAVVATEEKAAEYAARKKAEAQKDLEARRASHEMGDGGETMPSKEQYASIEQRETPPEISQELFRGGTEEQVQQQQGGSILRAIGETIMEIGQTTKELLIGQYPIQVLKRKDEPKFTEKHYPGAGKGT